VIKDEFQLRITCTISNLDKFQSHPWTTLSFLFMRCEGRLGSG